MHVIPCFNFPTKLLLVDDDKEFLRMLQMSLEDKYQSVATSDLNTARKLVADNQGWVQALCQPVISRVYQEDDPTLFSVGLNISHLKDQIYNPDRFNHFAILIVDYDMPGQNGLEFVRSLEDKQIKVIMFTGKAGQETVIKAFNDKEIDRYVSKGNPNYTQIIMQSIEELQNEFFINATKFITDSVNTLESDIFGNKAFQEIFHQIIKENNIIEYYLIDELGSFLFQSADADKQVGLIIKSKEELRYLFDLASDDKDTPANIIQQLSDCQILPYFKNVGEEQKISAKLWNFVDAQPLGESKEYYYAVIKDKDLGIENSKVKNYSEFLQKK